MPVQSEIRAIAYYLPEKKLGNAELAYVFEHWTPEKIAVKLGIVERPIAAESETAADMAVKAGEKLFAETAIEQTDIDFLLFCTQSPDYFLPTSACIIHEQLGLPKSCGALDFNLGCSGYIYGLSLAKGLIETEAAKNVLLITSETYSKYINAKDRTSRPLFGDGSAATLISGAEWRMDSAATQDSNNQKNHSTPNSQRIGPFVFGTDGGGANLLIVPAGGHRLPRNADTAVERIDSSGSTHSQEQLKMNGAGILSFAIDRIPSLVDDLLNKSGLRREDIGCYVFHQANKYMLDRLQELCGLAGTNFFNDIRMRGNTVSSSIPIAICDAWRSGILKPNEPVMLIGFGVGLSWGGTLIRLPENFAGQFHD